MFIPGPVFDNVTKYNCLPTLGAKKLHRLSSLKAYKYGFKKERSHRTAALLSGMGATIIAKVCQATNRDIAV